MSPPTLLTIPRELRQHILGYAFDDACEKDAKINDFLRYIHATESKLPFCSQRPGLRQLFNGPRSIETNERPGPAFFPNLYHLALVLRLAIPELRDDMLYVLENALSACVETNAATEEKAKDDFWRHIWAIYPRCAKAMMSQVPRALRMRPLNLS
ncbi:hypothetical protein EG328_011131 [Venturia inaequalis]|uniref:Uncharacterized protein n=1 Tax=Venturia inaequalis TaxID=5025 RepID=A0A8H3VIG7_VENIN|nr:hypothetical protein EG328_011131 [Venturia inaequalis]